MSSQAIKPAALCGTNHRQANTGERNYESKSLKLTGVATGEIDGHTAQAGSGRRTLGALREVAWSLSSLPGASLPLRFYEAAGACMAVAFLVMTTDWKHGKASLLS